jgi:hypothetical protein
LKFRFVLIILNLNLKTTMLSFNYNSFKDLKYLFKI